MLGQLERNTATRYSDPARTLRNGSKKTEMWTFPEKWKESSNEVEKKCKEITKVVDGNVKQAKENNMTDVSKRGTALPDNASASERNVKDRLMGSRAKLPSGSGTVEVDDNVAGALCHSALDSASFPAPD